MRKLFLFSLAILGFLILGVGCNFQETFYNEPKIDQEKLDRIKGSSSGVIPLAGPFAHVKFTFYLGESGEGASSADSTSSTYRVNMYTGAFTYTTNPAMTALGELKPIQQILTEAPQGKIMYSHAFNSQVIDEVRCFEGERDYCQRYLAVDQNRSIILTDYSQKELYKMFSFELQSPKPVDEDWGLYEQKELPYTFYYPKIGGIGIGGQFSSSPDEPDSQIVEIISYATTAHQTNASLANTILTRIETLAEKELDKLVSSRQSFLGASSTTVRTVNSIPVTSLCYTDVQRKVCEHYYVRPGQRIVRVTDYTDQKIHTDLYFKYFYPYEPLQILED